jgi:hypothetical protein
MGYTIKMSEEYRDFESFTVRFQPGAQEQVVEALGGLMTEGVVEIAPDVQQPPLRYNPDVVEAIIDWQTGQPIAILTPVTFQRMATELGMDEAQGTRVHGCIAHHFFHKEGIQIDADDRLRGIPAGLFATLVGDLRQGHVDIKRLGAKGKELAEHLLGRLYVSEE